MSVSETLQDLKTSIMMLISDKVINIDMKDSSNIRNRKRLHRLVAERDATKLQAILRHIRREWYREKSGGKPKPWMSAFTRPAEIIDILSDDEGPEHLEPPPLPPPACEPPALGALPLPLPAREPPALEPAPLPPPAREPPAQSFVRHLDDWGEFPCFSDPEIVPEAEAPDQVDDDEDNDMHTISSDDQAFYASQDGKQRFFVDLQIGQCQITPNTELSTRLAYSTSIIEPSLNS